MPRARRPQARRRPAARRRRRAPAALWGALGSLAVAAGVALLLWVRTPGGGSAWLAKGADKLYGEVQARIDEAAASVLPALDRDPWPADGSAAAWPLPVAGGAAAIRCQLVAAPAGLSLAETESRLTAAVARAGGRVLWRERLPRDPAAAPAASGKPRDRQELLRLDLGAPGRPTHTLVLYAPAAGRPAVRWLLPRDGGAGAAGEAPAGIAGAAGAGSAAASAGRAGPAGPAETAAPAGPAAAGGGPLLAIVIDDWGAIQNAATRRLLALEEPLTMAVLPGQRHSARCAAEATPPAIAPLLAAARRPGGGGAPDAPDALNAAGPRAAAARRQAELSRQRLARGCPVALAVVGEQGPVPGAAAASGAVPARRRETILHLPMEAEGVDPAGLGPYGILAGQPADEIERRLAAALATTPGVTGVSNHMGSRATADTLTMDRLLAALRARDLFFLDSLTTPRSAAAAAAARHGVPLLRNRLFLDEGRPGADVVRSRLRELADAARRSGAAVGIGHPHPETAAVLAEELPRLRREGVRLVTLSELLALRGIASGPAPASGAPASTAPPAAPSAPWTPPAPTPPR